MARHHLSIGHHFSHTFRSLASFDWTFFFARHHFPSLSKSIRRFDFHNLNGKMGKRLIRTSRVHTKRPVKTAIDFPFCRRTPNGVRCANKHTHIHTGNSHSWAHKAINQNRHEKLTFWTVNVDFTPSSISSSSSSNATMLLVLILFAL